MLGRVIYRIKQSRIETVIENKIWIRRNKSNIYSSRVIKGVKFICHTWCLTPDRCPPSSPHTHTSLFCVMKYASTKHVGVWKWWQKWHCALDEEFQKQNSTTDRMNSPLFAMISRSVNKILKCEHVQTCCGLNLLICNSFFYFYTRWILLCVPAMAQSVYRV